MHIWREYRSKLINDIVNHPAIHPWVCADGEYLDIGPFLDDRRNVLLMGDHGAVMFMFSCDGAYEAHIQVLPEGRGPWALEFTQDCLSWMFTHTPCVEIFTRVPDGNRKAQTMAIAVGGIKGLRRADGWEKDGKKIGCDVYSLQMADWAKKANGLEPRGVELHDEFAALGMTEEDYGEHEQRNRYAGLAALLIEGGQPMKAQWWYNTWAAKAGAAPLQIQSANPLIFTMGRIVIEYDGAVLRAVSCL